MTASLQKCMNSCTSVRGAGLRGSDLEFVGAVSALSLLASCAIGEVVQS